MALREKSSFAYLCWTTVQQLCGVEAAFESVFRRPCVARGRQFHLLQVQETIEIS